MKLSKNVVAVIIATLFYMVIMTLLNYYWTGNHDLKKSIIQSMVTGIIFGVVLYFIDRRRVRKT